MEQRGGYSTQPTNVPGPNCLNRPVLSTHQPANCLRTWRQELPGRRRAAPASSRPRAQRLRVQTCSWPWGCSGLSYTFPTLFPAQESPKESQCVRLPRRQLPEGRFSTAMPRIVSGTHLSACQGSQWSRSLLIRDLALHAYKDLFFLLFFVVHTLCPRWSSLQLFLSIDDLFLSNLYIILSYILTPDRLGWFLPPPLSILCRQSTALHPSFTYHSRGRNLLYFIHHQKSPSTQ
jgi:hypothetical protein